MSPLRRGKIVQLEIAIERVRAENNMLLPLVDRGACVAGVEPSRRLTLSDEMRVLRLGPAAETLALP